MKNNKIILPVVVIVLTTIIVRTSGAIDTLKAYYEKKHNAGAEVQEFQPPEQQAVNQASADELAAKAAEEANREAQKLFGVYYKAQDYMNAVYYGEKVVAYDPGNVRNVRALAYSYFALNYYDQSLENYNKALLLDPNNEEIKQSIAAVAARKNGENPGEENKENKNPY